jgi:hypothetical protein
MAWGAVFRDERDALRYWLWRAGPFRLVQIAPHSVSFSMSPERKALDSLSHIRDGTRKGKELP